MNAWLACRWRVWLALSVVCVLQACASSAGRSTTQLLHVETPGCVRARCTLSNDFGSWQVDPTPGDVMVTTSEKPLEVSCRAHDQQASDVRPPNPLRAVASASGVAGAAIGAGVVGAAAAPLLATPYAPVAGIVLLISAAAGAGVGRAADAASRTWSYPATVSVPLQCDAAGDDAVALAAAFLGLAVRPSSIEDRSGGRADAAMVTALAPGGRAATAGLQVGDLIVAVDDRPVAGAAGLQALVRGASQTLSLKVVRGARTVVILVPPPEQQ
jgi:membrane-associated protease RseP (regulator of RpoE activity)